MGLKQNQLPRLLNPEYALGALLQIIIPSTTILKAQKPLFTIPLSLFVALVYETFSFKFLIGYLGQYQV
ncbi:hypothetical protein MASR1M65_21250 [Saprospiraceae bacterium]|nr:hypothetical protein [Saprospiraceae bacterium]